MNNAIRHVTRLLPADAGLDEAADYHVRPPRRVDRRRVFCLEQERVVSREQVVRHENR